MKSLVDFILENKTGTLHTTWGELFLSYAKQNKFLSGYKEVSNKLLKDIAEEENFCYANSNGEGKEPLTFDELSSLWKSVDSITVTSYKKGSKYRHVVKDKSETYMFETDNELYKKHTYV